MKTISGGGFLSVIRSPRQAICQSIRSVYRGAAGDAANWSRDTWEGQRDCILSKCSRMVKVTEISDDDLREEFLGMNMKIDSETVLDAMKVLCIKLGLDPEALLEEWLALMVKDIAKSKTQERIITEEQVKAFQLAFESRKKAEETPQHSTPLSKTPAGRTQYRTPSSAPRSSTKPALNAGTPSTFGGRQQQEGGPSLWSGRIDFDDGIGAGGGNQQQHLRSSGKKPERSSVPFSARQNRLEVTATLGKLPEGLTWTQLPTASRQLKVCPKDPSSCLSQPYPAMFVKFQEVALALNNNIDDLGAEMTIAHSLPDYSAPTSIGDATATLGRLLPDLDGTLNPRNLWLQSSSTFHNGVKGPLDVELTPKFSLFPGQVIACAGHGNARAFAVNDIFQGVPPPAVKINLSQTDTLHIVVACGPFNIMGEPHDAPPEPLQELVRYVKESKPDLVILLGPFIDPKLTQDEAFLAQDYVEHYFRLMMELVIDEFVGKLRSHVVLVPSAGQLVGTPIYPIPPYTLDDCVRNPGLYNGPDYDGRIIFVPEPALLNVNGLVVGLTSTDIISHLCQKEVAKGMQGDERLPRMAGHLLQQQSFYPLYPTEVAADIAALNVYAKIRVRPHILITPSDMKGFVKILHGTVCINPERMAKGFSGGSFARIFIPPGKEDADPAAVTSLEGKCSLFEILRI
ncbi:DNA polymerase alpha subunit B [Hypsibius exemplaris]|uniref:DNA polymerase alpha subunit B n=1 Tax=Hypsibius exemplaris TaxID=2072580 RepID=A0A9X6RMF6_HYPEX|nr:DNA polymerase alpha subunit B [Hypsibius exemplaris]